MIVLAAVCLLFAGKSEVMRVPTLASVLSLPQHRTDSLLADDYIQADTLPVLADALPADTAEQPQADTLLKKPVPTELPKALPQTKLYLPAFYAALAKTDKQSVRVVHFGDSQIEEDRISMVLRHRLQERFGGGGIGLVPMVQTIPTYTAKQELEQNGHEVPNTVIKRYVAYGPSSFRRKDNNSYGPMAQVAYVQQPVDITIELMRDRVPTNDYDRIRILYSDSVLISLQPDSLLAERIVKGAPINDTTPSAEPMVQEILVLSEPQRSSMLHFEGDGYVYGLSLETKTGVQVDNIPMRGAAGTNFITMDRRLFASYFRATNTALVIMQFGGNAMPVIRTQAAVDKYIQSMRQQIHFIMGATQGTSLLFIGPSDMITMVDGEQRTYPMLPNLDRALAEMVAEEGGSYYSLFRLMGGAGSMVSWRDKGLAGEDMIHFTRAGAKKVGEMLAKQLLEDYDYIIQNRDTIN